MNQTGPTEIETFKTIYDALEPLEDEARSRVVKSVVTLLAINAPVLAGPEEGVADEAAEVAADEAAEIAPTYSTFAELHAAANPSTLADRALVAGYWLQVCQGNDTFTAQAANKELTHLGHKVANITTAFDTLKSAKPALILQIRKSGSSQQARKTLKVSQSGVKRVEEMIGG